MSSEKIELSLLTGYSDDVSEQVKMLIETGRLDTYLKSRYTEDHNITSNKALFAYVQDIKRTYMKKGDPIHKISFDDRIDTVYNALGLHSFVSRVQGRKLKATSEIRIASVFKKLPADLLYMIVVHELAHLKEKEHNKNFYRLCHHMDGEYNQHEFDLRLFLINKEI